MTSLRSMLYVGAVALLVAIFPWGANGFEGYYTGLRFLICGISAFAAYVALREGSALAIPFVLVGLLFNPFVKAHANREMWIVADVLVAAGFIATARLAPRLDAARVVTLPLGPADESTSEVQPAESSS